MAARPATCTTAAPVQMGAAVTDLLAREHLLFGEEDMKDPNMIIQRLVASIERGGHVKAAVVLTAGTVRSHALKNVVDDTGCAIGPTIVLDAWPNSCSSTLSANRQSDNGTEGGEGQVHVYHPANCSSRTDFEVLYGPGKNASAAPFPLLLPLHLTNTTTTKCAQATNYHHVKKRCVLFCHLSLISFFKKNNNIGTCLLKGV